MNLFLMVKGILKIMNLFEFNDYARLMTDVCESDSESDSDRVSYSWLYSSYLIPSDSTWSRVPGVE